MLLKAEIVVTFVEDDMTWKGDEVNIWVPVMF